MAGPDLSAVTTLVDFSTVLEAVLTVAAVLVYVYVAVKGAKMLLAAVGGGVFVNNAGDRYSERQLDKIWREMGDEEKDDWGFGSKADFMEMFQRVDKFRRG